MAAMGTLYLVRHGQASFGADDYDNLSPLGHQQRQRLGEYFKERGLGVINASPLSMGLLTPQVRVCTQRGVGWPML